jgi:hypothetical protein
MNATNNNEVIHQVRKLIELARLAPSAHNSQPWQFQLHGNTLHLFVNNEHALHAGDPTARGVWLGMGIMFETLVQSAAALGMAIKVEKMQTSSTEQPVATIIFLPVAHPKPDKTLEASIRNRFTYRGKLSEKSIPPSILKSLQEVTKNHHLKNVEILATQDKNHIELAGRLTKKGLRLAFSSAAFRRELSDFIHPNWTKARTGLTGFVLNKNALGVLWEKWSIRLNLGNEEKANVDAHRVHDAPLLVFIATTGDVPNHWFNAGRAYMLTALELTRKGMLHSTLAAPIEAADYHEELEAALHTKLRLQCMMIAGYPPGSEKHHITPRLTVDELLVID